jgi:hypothetical protein
MEAISSKPKRPIVVDFLATLFVTFCIGVATSIVLGACVVLMAREVHGAELAPMKPSQAQQGTLLFKSDETGETVAAAEETRAHVIELALTHHLVTKYTSLIAIDRPADRTPARPADLDLKMAALPTNLPDGHNYESYFGGAPQTDALVAGQLPQGATDNRFNLLAGALTLLFAAMLLLYARTRGFRRWARRRLSSRGLEPRDLLTRGARRDPSLRSG